MPATALLYRPRNKAARQVDRRGFGLEERNVGEDVVFVIALDSVPFLGGVVGGVFAQDEVARRLLPLLGHVRNLVKVARLEQARPLPSQAVDFQAVDQGGGLRRTCTEHCVAWGGPSPRSNSIPRRRNSSQPAVSGSLPNGRRAGRHEVGETHPHLSARSNFFREHRDRDRTVITVRSKFEVPSPDLAETIELTR